MMDGSIKAVKVAYRLLAIVFLVLSAGCEPGEGLPPASHRGAIVAVAIPLEQAGLLPAIIPEFQRLHSLTPVKVLAVGSGQAVKLAREGKADVLLTHLPSEEKKLVDEGHAVGRWEIMKDDFLLVGPAADPAGARSAPDAAEAFRRVGAGMHAFVTRGDGSGTHQAELAVWDKTEVVLASNWYLSAKRGPAETLVLAAERKAYTLTDRATFLARAKFVPPGTNTGQEAIFEGDPLLTNTYSIVLISAPKHPGVNQRAGQVFVDWMRSPETAKLISAFGVKEWGRAPYTAVK